MRNGDGWEDDLSGSVGRSSVRIFCGSGGLIMVLCLIGESSLVGRIVVLSGLVTWLRMFSFSLDDAMSMLPGRS